MTDPQHRSVPASVGASDEELTQQLRKIEQRDWWFWGYSILVMLLLTFALISFSLPALHGALKTFIPLKVGDAVFGLIALVLVFNVYTIYQQILRNLAMVDPLTGLYNRRFAMQRLASEVARSERRGHPLTVLTLDLNDFKQINDMHGHPAGDQVLQEFATHLNRVIRGSDLAVRLGGDEFLVLLPECTLEQLQLVLGRLGSLVVDWQGHKIPVTFSSGWRQYQLGDRPEELLARADQALYAGKRANKKAPNLAKTVETDADPTPHRG